MKDGNEFTFIRDFLTWLRKQTNGEVSLTDNAWVWSTVTSQWELDHKEVDDTKLKFFVEAFLEYKERVGEF